MKFDTARLVEIRGVNFERQEGGISHGSPTSSDLVKEEGDDPSELLRVLVHHAMPAAGDLDDPCTGDPSADNKCIFWDADYVLSPVQDQCR